MSMKIDDYLNSISTLAVSMAPAAAPAADTAAKAADSPKDSYITSMVDSTEAIPSDSYNDILKIIQSAKADTPKNNPSSEEAMAFREEAEKAVQEAGSGGSSSEGGESGDKVTTKIVTMNGVTYLETTTTKDGVTTVTRRVISVADARAPKEEKTLEW